MKSSDQTINKPLPQITLQEARHTLKRAGYVLIPDSNAKLGFSPKFREHLLASYFNNGKLKLESYDVYPPDRERARDVVRYHWDGVNLRLEEHDTVAINGRSYASLKRDYPRVEILADPVFRDWVKAALALVPFEERQAAGTFGINLFRTHSNVVSGPHQDDEEFAFLYVIDKVGGGAETGLYEKGSTVPFYSHTLKPGELIVFDDRRFLHSTSSLNPAPDGGAPHRDVVVCTVNKPETYPLGV
jgi:hypothetical protein